MSYDKGKKRLSLSMKEWTEAAARDESEVPTAPRNPPTKLQTGIRVPNWTAPRNPRAKLNRTPSGLRVPPLFLELPGVAGVRT